MVRGDFSNPTRIQVLWETGIRNVQRLHNMTGIPERTIFRYARRLRNGEVLDRRPYPPRTRVITPGIMRKVIRKATTSKRSVSFLIALKILYKSI